MLREVREVFDYVLAGIIIGRGIVNVREGLRDGVRENEIEVLVILRRGLGRIFLFRKGTGRLVRRNFRRDFAIL